MSENSGIHTILAADYRSHGTAPENDQIWELNTLQGEPPGVALQTTYGLRAYGMRVFPRFVLRGIPTADPRSFSTRPQLLFSAPNFITLGYSPFPSLDVRQKVWVPDSQTLVGQVTLTNTTSSLLQLVMEWVVQLNPLFAGSPMYASQISVNTVLQGQTGHIYPVFFLTGGPRGDVSAFPSLGIEVSLVPHASRQFSWALASLDSTDASFYDARKSTAYSLDNEEIKISMLQKNENVSLAFEEPVLTELVKQSQRRTAQFLLPAYHNFSNPSYITSRNPDQGFKLSEKGKDFAPDWGVQRITELWEISRIFLPSKPELMKQLISNLIQEQGYDGTIYAQTGWNGNITSLPAIPLIASLVMDVFQYDHDHEWLIQVYPALIRSLQVWFKPENDPDGDGWPQCRHLLQTGILESPYFDRMEKSNLEWLIKVADWPSLAALLFSECQKLTKKPSF